MNVTSITPFSPCAMLSPGTQCLCSHHHCHLCPEDPSGLNFSLVPHSSSFLPS